MLEQRTIRVVGLVQGVFFRASARDEARRLGLAGSVRNQPDGSVLISAEGPPAALDAFTAWCRHGPPRARVDRLDVTPGPPTGAATFESIR